MPPRACCAKCGDRGGALGQECAETGKTRCHQLWQSGISSSSAVTLTLAADSKADHLDALAADVVATGNIGCATQIARFSGVPVVHTVELLDWATGGPALAALNYLPQE